MTTDSRNVGAIFFAATRALACDTGSLQERLADTYADHLLQVVAHDLPADLQPLFRELEMSMSPLDVSDADDPFRAATQRMSDAEARELIERVVALFARLAALGSD
jgi:hypothetical protein